MVNQSSSQKKDPNNEKSLSEELVDKVHTMKENFDKGDMPFKDEFNSVKKAAAGKTKELGSMSRGVVSRASKNWDILLGVPFLAVGLYQLLDIIVGISLILLGLLFILGYIKKRGKNGLSNNE